MFLRSFADLSCKRRRAVSGALAARQQSGSLSAIPVHPARRTTRLCWSNQTKRRTPTAAALIARAVVQQFFSSFPPLSFYSKNQQARYASRARPKTFTSARSDASAHDLPSVVILQTGGCRPLVLAPYVSRRADSLEDQSRQRSRREQEYENPADRRHWR